LLLYGANLEDATLECLSHLRMHDVGVVAFDEIGLPTVADEEAFEFFVRDAREDGGVGDLVAVEMKDGENGAVVNGVEKFVGVPGGGERASLGFTIADNYGDDEVGVIEGRAEAVREAVA